MSRMANWFAAVAVVCLVALTFWRAAVSQTVNNTVTKASGLPPIKKRLLPTADVFKSEARFERDISFARPGGQTLQIDLAIPNDGTGPFPAVVCLHSGGWVSGDRKQTAKTIEVLARRGYVAASPDYRLAPKHPFPACLEDIKAAVRWLRANAGKYRIDPERIGVTGFSSAGHLACLMGVTDHSDGLEGSGGNADHSSAVQAVVAFSAPVDLSDEALWVEPTLTKNLIPLLGGHPRQKIDLSRKASPLHYTPMRPTRTLLIHGSNDAVVPVRQADALVERINRAGGKARLIVLDGEGHTFRSLALRQSIDQMLSFLDETLKK